MSLKFPISLVGKRISNWLGFGSASRSFDGVDQEVVVQANPSIPTGAQTWACWVKTEDLGSYADIISHWTNTGAASFVILKLQDNQIAFYITQAGSTAGSGSRFTQTGAGNTINVGSWHHVACVFDPNTSIKIYLDGILTATNSNSIFSSIYNSSEPLHIGERQDTVNRNWDGKIADVRSYNTVLTATDISDLYNGTDVQTNLVGHWLTNADNVLDNAGINDADNAFEPEYSLDAPIPANPVFAAASRNFNGVNDVVSLGNTNSRTSRQTVCAWVKADAFDSTYGNAYFSKWNGNLTNGREWLLWLSFVTPNTLEYRITQSDDTVIVCTAPTNIVLNQWTHVAGVADETNIYLYVDGSLVATTPYDGTNSLGGASVSCIGSINYPQTNAHNGSGKICDCRIYDTDLTASQISDLYAGTDVQTNLVGHWLRNTDDLLDYSGNNNHGSHNGSTYSTDGPKP